MYLLPFADIADFVSEFRRCEGMGALGASSSRIGATPLGDRVLLLSRPGAAAVLGLFLPAVGDIILDVPIFL
jgi:hypothetical protein